MTTNTMTTEDTNLNLLAELVFYIICHPPGGQIMDTVRINKTLWYFECENYLKSGKSLAGTQFISRPLGPVIYDHQNVIGLLVKNKCIREGHFNADGKHVKVYDPINEYKDKYNENPASQEVKKSQLTNAHRKSIDDLLVRMNKLNSDQLSKRSHGKVWNLIENGKPILLRTVFAEGRHSHIPKKHTAGIEKTVAERFHKNAG